MRSRAAISSIVTKRDAVPGRSFQRLPQPTTTPCRELCACNDTNCGKSGLLKRVLDRAWIATSAKHIRAIPPKRPIFRHLADQPGMILKTARVDPGRVGGTPNQLSESVWVVVDRAAHRGGHDGSQVGVGKQV